MIIELIPLFMQILCKKLIRELSWFVLSSCSSNDGGGTGTHLSKLRFVSLCGANHDGTAADVSPVDVHPSTPSSSGVAGFYLTTPPKHH